MNHSEEIGRCLTRKSIKDRGQYTRSKIIMVILEELPSNKLYVDIIGPYNT